MRGANFYVSCKQLLEAEKRIRALSLIKSGQSLSFESEMLFDDAIADHVEQVELILFTAANPFLLIYGTGISRHILMSSSCRSVLKFFMLGFPQLCPLFGIFRETVMQEFVFDTAVPMIKSKQKLACRIAQKTEIVDAANHGGFLVYPTDITFIIVCLSYIFFKSNKGELIKHQPNTIP